MRAQKQPALKGVIGRRAVIGSVRLPGLWDFWHSTVFGIAEAFVIPCEFCRSNEYDVFGVKEDQLGHSQGRLACRGSMSPGGRQQRAWAAVTASTAGTVSEPESPHIWLELALVCFQSCTQTTTLAVRSRMVLSSFHMARGQNSPASPGPRVKSAAFCDPSLFLLAWLFLKEMSAVPCGHSSSSPLCLLLLRQVVNYIQEMVSALQRCSTSTSPQRTKTFYSGCFQ